MIIISLNMHRAAHDRLHKENRLRAADSHYHGVAPGRRSGGSHWRWEETSSVMVTLNPY